MVTEKVNISKINIIQAIGGEVAKETFDMTHLVAREFKRTVKWFCALHTGKNTRKKILDSNYFSEIRGETWMGGRIF